MIGNRIKSMVIAVLNIQRKFFVAYIGLCFDQVDFLPNFNKLEHARTENLF